MEAFFGACFEILEIGVSGESIRIAILLGFDDVCMEVAIKITIASWIPFWSSRSHSFWDLFFFFFLGRR